MKLNYSMLAVWARRLDSLNSVEKSCFFSLFSSPRNYVQCFCMASRYFSKYCFKEMEQSGGKFLQGKHKPFSSHEERAMETSRSLCLIRPNTCSTGDMLIKLSGLRTSNLHLCFEILCKKKRNPPCRWKMMCESVRLSWKEADADISRVNIFALKTHLSSASASKSGGALI